MEFEIIICSKIRQFDVKWVYVVWYELILRLDGQFESWTAASGTGIVSRLNPHAAERHNFWHLSGP